MIPSDNIDFYGDQTRWFIGIVKSINDPQKLGRIQVRIKGVHSDSLIEIPDADLPWAQVVAPITGGGTNELGNALGVQPDAMVFGIFLDGQNSQLPLVLGFIPKYEGDNRDTVSTSRLATGTNTISKTPDSVTGEDQLTDPYGAVYPHNKAYQTTSGHAIEIDDTPNAERIHIYHKSGTFVEMHPNGDVVTHHKNGFRTVTGNDKLHVTGNMNIVVDENLTISAKNMTTTVEQSITQTSETLSETAASGNVTYSGGEITVSGITHTQHTHVDNPGLAGARTTGPSG